MSLFRNRIFTVAALVTLVSGFGMMGSLFYIPLFVQGIIGSSATNSGLVTMPMMIAMACASAVSGQLMSRLGRYRVLGVCGQLLTVGGFVLLAGMDVNSSNGDATRAMIVLGAGLGMSMPLFMLAVQNAVPYRIMGVSTSTMQFLRSVGGTMGVAVMFSLIHGQYGDGLVQNVPQAVQAEPQLFHALDDPQFLLNSRAYEQVQAAFSALGPQGQVAFEQTIQAVRLSLADAISSAFFISIFVMAAAVAIGVFIKEIPLRKAHVISGEPDVLPPEEPPVTTAGAAPALSPPITGGANGHRTPD
jgi:hypothetical protein